MILRTRGMMDMRRSTKRRIQTAVIVLAVMIGLAIAMAGRVGAHA
jgi:hypothetical protein